MAPVTIQVYSLPGTGSVEYVYEIPEHTMTGPVIGGVADNIGMETVTGWGQV